MSIFKSKELIINALRDNDSVIEVKGELLKELQKVELEMLKDINDICSKNGIDIFLGGGTLLGAVRHKGFIPWDDDIDLNINRKDVNSFIQLVSDNLSDKYIIRYNNEKSFRPFIKIEKKNTIYYEPDYPDENIGVTIDVFIIEDLPKSKIRMYIYGVICTIKLFIASCLSFYENKNERFIKLMKSELKTAVNYYVKRAIGFLFSFDSYVKRIEKNDKYFSKYCNINSDFVCIPTGRGHFFGEIYPKKMFLNVSSMEFNGIKCKSQLDYDLYLKKLYGLNYMQIPPVEKREHHYVFNIKL